MRYCLCLALSLFLSAWSVQAAENDSTPIMVIYPSDGDNYVNTDNMPDCNDSRLISEVKEAIRSYLDDMPPMSILDYRKRHLVLKNIEKYTEVAIDEFKPSDNYLVANELTTTKINQHMTNSDFRLCASGGQKPIYLLIYPEDFRYRVQIIDFIAPTSKGNAFSLLYTPTVKQYDKIELDKSEN